MIKVVICDGDGTVGLPNPSDEIRKLVESLQELGMQLAVASNSKRGSSYVKARFRAARLPVPEIVMTQKEMGVRKASPEFVYAIRDQAGVDLNEIVYIGDNDGTDIFCATNAGVLPFAAKYSRAVTAQRMEYGIPIASPTDFLLYLSTFGRQNKPYFGWEYNALDPTTGSYIQMYALIGQHRDRYNLKPILKDHRNKRLGSSSFLIRTLLFYYLISQCYMSGLSSEVNFVTVYPGYRQGKFNPTMQGFSKEIGRSFKQGKFIPDLLLRHRDAPESKQQEHREIFDQFRTIHVNPEYRKKIRGRTILVADDFTTTGHSFETARCMLLQAGARHVIGVAVAKWRYSYSTVKILKPWDPFVPCTLEREEIQVTDRSGTMNEDADDYFWDTIWAAYSA